MKLAPEDFPEIIANLNQLAIQKGYSKIFAKIPISWVNKFLDDGYIIEAHVPSYYLGDKYAFALFIAKYFDLERKKTSKSELEDFKIMIEQVVVQEEVFLDSRFQFKKPAQEDVTAMSELYQKVFRNNPFPIHESDYISQRMQENIVYFGIWEQKDLIALASAEIDLELLNVELTDFAISPEYRGNQLALFLLKQMEVEMKKRGIITAYTIAQLKSPAMNITFKKAGYQYTGTLINNTNICGSFESMNVWYKRL